MSVEKVYMSKKEIGDLIWSWKVDGETIQHKPHDREWYDLDDAQVIKELMYYGMRDGKGLYRVKPF